MKKWLHIICLLMGTAASALGQTYSEPQRLPVNSGAADFGAVWYGDGMVFSSERNNSTAGVTHVERESGNFLADLFFAKRKDSLKWARPNRLSAALNTNFHEGPVAVAADSSSLFLVRSLPLPIGKRRTESAALAEILYVEATGRTWKQAAPLALGPPATYTDPFLSTDGKWLYFASDMPGGQGGLDLYRIAWPLDGQQAQHLGASINTPQNERSPFVAADGKLYFSTSGHPGLGGMDIFSSREFRGEWRMPENLGAPINTEFEDYGFSLSSTGDEGFLCSNRRQGGMDEDIFYFAVTRTVEWTCAPQQRNSYCYVLSEEGTGPLPIPSLFYRWDLGDGTQAKGVQVDHCFSGPGDYRVSLSVVDSLTDLPVFQQTEYLLEIRDAVQADIYGPDSIALLVAGKWRASADNLPGFEAERFEWDFGDGEKLEGDSVSHVYDAPGEYVMRLAAFGKDANDPEMDHHCVTRTIFVGGKGTPLSDSFEPRMPTITKPIEPRPPTKSTFAQLPQTYFKIQAGTAPLDMADAVAADPRLNSFERLADGQEIRYVLPDSLGFEAAMRKLQSIRERGFSKPALLVFRGDSLLPHQPFLDHWLPADGIEEVLVRGVVTDREQVPKGGTVVWENLATGDVEVETRIDPQQGTFEQRLLKDVFYGYFVDLEGYYSLSKHLDLRHYKGDLVVTDSLVLYSISDLVRDHIPVRINNLFFDFDKAEIRPESHRELYRLVRFLLESPGLQIEIAGHTDNWGEEAYNEDLSRRRAGAVARFLVLSGCDPASIVPKGYGESRPILPNSSPSNRQMNRRVEFSVLSNNLNN